MNNGQSIKPIETVYNGYRFRSRLEARWAVFFDRVGIPYEYESEGFEFKDGTKYLPDFYLPWFHAYVEIKPKHMDEHSMSIAKSKCEKMFSKPGCIVLLCAGDPVECDMEVYCNESDDDGGGTMWMPAMFVEGAWFADKPWEEDECWGTSKHFIVIVVGEKTDQEERRYSDSDWLDCCLYQRSRLRLWRSTFEHAKEYARQARFEHGEKPIF